MELEDLAKRIRDGCIEAALQAYEDAGIHGLCTEGRWKAAVSALRTVELARPLRELEHSFALSPRVRQVCALIDPNVTAQTRQWRQRRSSGCAFGRRTPSRNARNTHLVSSLRGKDCSLSAQTDNCDPVRIRGIFLAAPGSYAHPPHSVRHFGNSTSLSLASVDGSNL